MKFFLPDWEDRLDPFYDFERDKYSKSHLENSYENDVYAHQLFKIPPHDGILFSLGVFKSKISLKDYNKPQIRGSSNIKEFFKIEDKNIEVMGDCGAFTYAYEDKPPEFYKTERVAKIYEKMGFDYGVSVDHLVLDYFLKKENGKKIRVDVPKEKKDERIKLTIRNAKEFLNIHRKNRYSFEPIGVAQGYNLETYKKSVEKLVELGYEYIALGSLVRYNTETILKILETIEDVTSNVKLHLFGVLRPEAIKDFRKLGVVSFDSASYLRKAWLRSGNNYLALDGDEPRWYTAIRVPYSDNPRLVKNSHTNGYSITQLKAMEKKALSALFKYERGSIKNVDDVLKSVMKYDKLLLRNSENIDKFEEKYRKTLEDKPWKKCKCDVCKSIGIDVVIFRGTNRNKRRGFHNVWMFRNFIMDQ